MKCFFKKIFFISILIGTVGYSFLNAKPISHEDSGRAKESAQTHQNHKHVAHRKPHNPSFKHWLHEKVAKLKKMFSFNNGKHHHMKKKSSVVKSKAKKPKIGIRKIANETISASDLAKIVSVE